MAEQVVAFFENLSDFAAYLAKLPPLPLGQFSSDALVATVVEPEEGPAHDEAFDRTTEG
jgi:hypothetical protein